jgi:hypothetical protein
MEVLFIKNNGFFTCCDPSNLIEVDSASSFHLVKKMNPHQGKIL